MNKLKKYSFITLLSVLSLSSVYLSSDAIAADTAKLKDKNIELQYLDTVGKFEYFEAADTYIDTANDDLRTLKDELKSTIDSFKFLSKEEKNDYKFAIEDQNHDLNITKGVKEAKEINHTREVAFNVAEAKRKEEERIAEEKRKAELNSTMPAKAFEVTAIFESNNKNPGAILGVLDDGAGQNYGTYSLTQVHTMYPYLNFLSKYYPDLRNALVGEVNSWEFNESWQNLGISQPEKFKESQAQFLFEKNIIPVIERFKRDTGVNLLDETHSVGAVGMFSGMIHNAGISWYDYLVSAAKTAKTENGFDDVLFIKEAAGYVANNYNGVYASAIRSRYVRQPLKEIERTDKFFYKKMF